MCSNMPFFNGRSTSCCFALLSKYLLVSQKGFHKIFQQCFQTSNAHQRFLSISRVFNKFTQCNHPFPKCHRSEVCRGGNATSGRQISIHPYRISTGRQRSKFLAACVAWLRRYRPVVLKIIIIISN